MVGKWFVDKPKVNIRNNSGSFSAEEARLSPTVWSKDDYQLGFY
jgi:hypothetical protein